MVQISARNSEFAVATGGNIGAGRGTSRFDIPADAFSDLSIVSDPGDHSPYLFSVGETYTLSYTDGDGRVAEIDAQIIRSDPLGSADGGAIVFQGVDLDHGNIQIVWTPNFDVDKWIDDTLASGRTPGFYTYDTQDQTYGYVCFAAGTPIATPSGCRAVEDLGPGDRVETLDGGPRRLNWVGQRRMLGVGKAAPVRFAPGVLGNTAPLWVSQNHRMLFAGPQVELLFGTREVLAPAKSFVNGSSVRLEPRREIRYVHLLFDTHEVLLAGGAAAESLFLGDVATEVLAEGPAADRPDVIDAAVRPEAPAASAAGPGMRAARMLLRHGEAQVLARALGLCPERHPGSCPPPQLLTA